MNESMEQIQNSMEQNEAEQAEPKHRITRKMRREEHRRRNWGGPRDGAGRPAGDLGARVTISPRISPDAKALYHRIKKEKNFRIEEIIENTIRDCAESLGIE